MRSAGSPARPKGAGQHDDTNDPDRFGYGAACVNRVLGFKRCYLHILSDTRQEPGLGGPECSPSEDTDRWPITRGSSGTNAGLSSGGVHQVGMVHMGPDPARDGLATVR